VHVLNGPRVLTLIDAPGLGGRASEFGEMPAAGDLLRWNHLDEIENLCMRQHFVNLQELRKKPGMVHTEALN